MKGFLKTNLCVGSFGGKMDEGVRSPKEIHFKQRHIWIQGT